MAKSSKAKSKRSTGAKPRNSPSPKVIDLPRGGRIRIAIGSRTILITDESGGPGGSSSRSPGTR